MAFARHVARVKDDDSLARSVPSQWRDEAAIRLL